LLVVTTKAAVEDFVNQRTLSVIGVSRSGRKFGNMAYRELIARDYKVYPINLDSETLEGDRAYRNLASLPEKVGGVVIVVPPVQTEKVVRDAAVEVSTTSGCSKDRSPRPPSCSARRTASAKSTAIASSGKPSTPASTVSMAGCGKCWAKS
jgi:hypothetical protein